MFWGALKFGETTFPSWRVTMIVGSVKWPWHYFATSFSFVASKRSVSVLPLNTPISCNTRQDQSEFTVPIHCASGHGMHCGAHHWAPSVSNSASQAGSGTRGPSVRGPSPPGESSRWATHSRPDEFLWFLRPTSLRLEAMAIASSLDWLEATFRQACAKLWSQLKTRFGGVA